MPIASEDTEVLCVEIMGADHLLFFTLKIPVFHPTYTCIQEN